jgi:hypothetical protein
MDHGVIECYLYERPKLGVVEHTCNPSTQVAEAG